LQTRVTQAGPLAAASATNIAAAQSAPGAGTLALNGSLAGAVTNNVCLSQSGTVATPLLINGSLAVAQYSVPTMGVTLGNVAYVPLPLAVSTASKTSNILSPAGGSPLLVSSAGNDSGITFKVVGYADHGSPIVVSETVTGANASVVSTANGYSVVLSITPSGNTASTVMVGTTQFAILDTPRRVIFTSSGTDTGITLTITGRDWAGSKISETVTGGSSGSPASTVLDYLAVTQVTISGATAGTISVGTNGVCASPWVNLDPWALGTVAGQTVVNGTVNYTVEVTNDDPDSYANPVARSAVTWNDSFAGVYQATASTAFSLTTAPLWARVLLNSETGTAAYVRMTLAQHGAVPL
jgi:hypothetical protein